MFRMTILVRFFLISFYFINLHSSFAGSTSEQEVAASPRTSLVTLNFAEREIRDISQFVSGRCFFLNDANENNFKKYSPKSKIIHLATHAIVNNEIPMYSKLVLSRDNSDSEDGILNAYELFNTKLDAELVILSACNTGVGKLIRGEGIMSLARSFMYAGCSNVMMSLWPVYDKPTAQIIKDFYSNLSDDIGKGQALRNAKLNFLAQADERTANPYYWAGLILIGDDQPIRLGQNNFMIFLGLTIGIVLLILLIYKKSYLKYLRFCISLLFPGCAVFLVLTFVLCKKSEVKKETEKITQLILEVDSLVVRAKEFYKIAQFDSAFYWYEFAAAQFQENENWIKYIDCVSKAVELQIRAGKIDEARDELSGAIKIVENRLGTKHPELAELFCSQGALELEYSQLDRAMEYLELSISIVDTTKENGQRTLIKDLLEISNIHFTKNEYHKNQEYIQNALKLGEKYFEKTDPLIAEIYETWGYSLTFYGVKSEGREYFRKALEILRENYDDDHPDVAEIYSNIGLNLIKSRKESEALKYLNQSLEITQKKLGPDHPGTVTNLLFLGRIWSNWGMYRKALEYYEEYFQYNQRFYGETSIQSAQPLANIASFHLLLGDTEKALVLYQQSISIFNKYKGNVKAPVSNVYLKIGKIYLERNLDTKALEYFDMAFDIARQFYDLKSHYMVARCYNAFAEVYQFRKQYDLALSYFEKSTKVMLVKHPTWMHPLIYNNLSDESNIYMALGEYEKAVNCLEKSYEIRKNIHRENHPLLGPFFVDVGKVYLEKGDYEAASSNYKKALDIGLTNFGSKHVDVAVAYQGLGDVFSGQNDLLKALLYYQKAICALVRNFDSEEIEENPNLENVIDETMLFSVLQKKAAALYDRYQLQTQDLKDLENVVHIYKLILNLVERLRALRQEFETKLYFNETIFPVFKQAIDKTFELYQKSGNEIYREKIFGLMERTKSSVLYQAILDARINKFAGVPDSLLTKLREMRLDIAAYKNQIHQESMKENLSDSTKLRILQKEIFDIDYQRNLLIQTIKNQYPKYYKLKYEHSDIQIADLQHQILDENTVLIEYFLSDRYIYIYSITRTDCEITRLETDSKFEENVRLMRDGLTQKDFAKYTQNAYLLYQQLIQPIENELGDIQNLIIIPDGLLGIIPFETLLTEEAVQRPPDYRSLSYLIKKYTILNHYSASILLENQGRTVKKCEFDYIGFAPVEYSDKNSSVPPI